MCSARLPIVHICDGLSDGNKETPVSLLFHYIEIELRSHCCGVNNFFAWCTRTSTTWYVLQYRGLGVHQIGLALHCRGLTVYWTGLAVY